MSNADRLRSGPGLPSSARLVDRAAEQRVPSTSPHPSLAHNGQWIRSDTRRYTLKGAASRDLNFTPPTAIAPSTSKTTHVPVKVLRKNNNNHRLQKDPPQRSGAPHRAPPSVRTFPSAANIQQTQVPSGLVVCRQHTQSTRKPTRNHSTNPLDSFPYSDPRSIAMSSTSNPPPT